MSAARSLSEYTSKFSPTRSIKSRLFNDDCHWMEPLLPINFKVEELIPLQTSLAPDISPETLTGVTLITIVEVSDKEQTPFFTMAL